MSKRIKHEIKVLTYHEMGMKLDDQLEAAKSEQSSFDGAKKAFALGRAKVEDLTAHIDKDVRDGVLDLEQSTLAKKWVLRAISVLQNLGIQAEVQAYQAQGKVVALSASVASIKALHDTERSLLETAIAAEKAQAESTPDSPEDFGRPAPRPSGEHPGDPLAGRREEAPPSDPAPEDQPKKKRKVKN